MITQDGWIIRVVGLDPTGGTDPLSPNVVWCPELTKNVAENRNSGIVMTMMKSKSCRRDCAAASAASTSTP